MGPVSKKALVLSVNLVFAASSSSAKAKVVKLLSKIANKAAGMIRMESFLVDREPSLWRVWGYQSRGLAMSSRKSAKPVVRDPPGVTPILRTHFLLKCENLNRVKI